MSDYSSNQFKEYTQKLRELQKELPSFCSEFFRGIDNTTLIKTRYSYAIDLKGFFRFLITQISEFGSETLSTVAEEYEKQVSERIKNLRLSNLNDVDVTHIELYLEHVSYYCASDGKEIFNKERAKARKLSSIRAMYKYFMRKEKITRNSPALVPTPELHDKAIVRLEPNEVADLLDVVQSGEGLSEKQKKYHEQTQLRDLAILTLFLGTGIRISELVGIDMDDINFQENEFSVIRKGGNQDILVFGVEARDALLSYILKREQQVAESGHENALFLSMQKKRITVRAVENLVKKYALIAVPLKKISPHKLRSTFGTSLYQETGDIYLVADVLGHKDVNTTRKHYAAISKDRRRIAAQVIKLRDNTDENDIKPPTSE